MAFDEKWKQETEKYCPKCGAILMGGDICPYCKHHLLDIDIKWGITKGLDIDLNIKCNNGEITEEEKYDLCLDYQTPFIEEVIKKNPEFNKEEYEKRVHGDRKICWGNDRIQWEKQGYAKCPYCKSYNTKKNVSFWKSLFPEPRYWEAKNRWHCKNCGSDF